MQPKKSLTIDLELIKKEATIKKVSHFWLMKKTINYREVETRTPQHTHCLQCELRRNATFSVKGEKIERTQCELIGISGCDRHADVDDKHFCDYYKFINLKRET